MKKAIIDSNGTLHALLEMEENDSWSGPDGMYLIDAEDFTPDPMKEDADYYWNGEIFTLKEQSESPADIISAASIIIAALPAITMSLTDAQAVQMKPYLSEWDANMVYPEGAVCLRYGKACRKTNSGWRELG